MTGRRRRVVRGVEDGAILILALGFLVLSGTLVAALLTLAGPNLVTTNVVQNVQNAIAAADAGVEYGIQVLRTGDTPPNTSTNPTNSIPCSAASYTATLGGLPTVDSETNDYGSGLQPNGTVRVTCSETLTGGSSAGGFGWAVIANDVGSSAIDDQGGGAKSITGPVYNAGNWRLEKPMTVKDGNVYTASPTCTASIPLLTVTPNPPYGEHCVVYANMPPPNVPHALPTAGPPANVTAAQVTTSGSCTTFVPGAYTSPNFTSASFNSDLAEDAYFESGTYYLNNLGNLNVGTSLFGGQPSAGESQATSNGPTACASDPNNWSTTHGTGVEIILGGNTTISVGNNSTFEIYTPTECSGCNDGSSPHISLYQVPRDSAGWNATPLSAATDFLTIGNGANVAAVVHGGIYGPDGSLNLFATNSSQAVTFGGMDVYDVSFKSSASATGLITTIATTPGVRTVSVSASAKLATGRVISATAVVEIANDASRTATIESWQVSQ